MKVALTTVTPIHIGNGESLSPYTDYVVGQRGTVYLMDRQKVNDRLASLENSDEAIDEFVNRVMGHQNTGKPFSLKQFFEQHGIDYQELARSICQTDADIKNEEIHETIKSASRPYIPGSSMKGAVKTALLYFHRKEKGYSAESAMMDIYGGKERKKSPNGEDVFGSYSEDVLKYLHISDTTLLAREDIGIVKTFPYHLIKKEATIPITKEVIPENKTLVFRLQSKSPKDVKLDRQFTYLYESEDFQGERQILQIMNQFSKQLIERELAVLRDFQVPHMKKIIHVYEKIYEAATTYEKEKNGAVIRLGSGKTYFDNTVASLFSDKEVTMLLKNLKMGGGRLFPKTRTVIGSGNLYDSVLGWAYLEPVQDMEGM